MCGYSSGGIFLKKIRIQEKTSQYFVLMAGNLSYVFLNYVRHFSFISEKSVRYCSLMFSLAEFGLSQLTLIEQ